MLMELSLKRFDREVESLPRLEDFEKSRAGQLSGIVQRHDRSTLRLQSAL
jgi:hypothetical protein